MILGIFALLAVTLFVFFWGITIFAHGYLYQEVVDKLPVRALGAAVLVAGVLVFWTNVNAKADRKGKYGPLHDFDSTGTTDIREFVAIRQIPAQGDQPATEQRITFKRPEGTKTLPFTEEKNNAAFRLNSTGYMTIALEYKLDDKPVRFDAVMTNGNYTPDKRFAEKDSKRFVEGNDPGMVYAPSTKTMIYAILLNLLMLLAWFAAFWPVLRYMFWHAVGLAFLCGAVTILIVAPILFEKARATTSNKAKMQSEQVAPLTPATGTPTIAPPAVDAPVVDSPVKE